MGKVEPRLELIHLEPVFGERLAEAGDRALAPFLERGLWNRAIHTVGG
jgi:hypothetical protein